MFRKRPGPEAQSLAIFVRVTSLPEGVDPDAQTAVQRKLTSQECPSVLAERLKRVRFDMSIDTRADKMG